jgi:excisionase family DNA binding protein
MTRTFHSNVRAELQSVLDSLQTTPPERLPELLGELEVVRTTALLRLSAPSCAPAHDELLSVEEAAERLGMSTDYIYRHAGKLPFARRMGRNVRFSSLGIDRYIAQNRPK